MREGSSHRPAGARGRPRRGLCLFRLRALARAAGRAACFARSVPPRSRRVARVLPRNGQSILLVEARAARHPCGTSATRPSKNSFAVWKRYSKGEKKRKVSFHECTFERATFRGLPTTLTQPIPSLPAADGLHCSVSRLMRFPSHHPRPLLREPLRTTSLKRSRDRYATEDRSANPTRPYTLASARITGRR